MTEADWLLDVARMRWQHARNKLEKLERLLQTEAASEQEVEDARLEEGLFRLEIKWRESNKQ